MNKIKIVNDIIVDSKLNKKVEITFLEKNELFDVNSIKIKVKESTNLKIEYDSDVDTKLDIFINILDNTKVKIFETRTGQKTKVQYKYYLEENSNCDTYKFYDSKAIRELDIINLNGIGASINCHLKTISKNEEKYDMMIYHNYSKTNSNIINHGVNINEGSLIFNVTSLVLNKKINCNVNQKNRILNMTDNACLIRPNLIIDENDTIANHSAFIGTFSNDELFYLESRGITRKQAINLLTRGFLLSELENDEYKKEVEELISKYWR